jgi:ATP-dependent 26S proteasome regulatory subunit
MILTTNRVESMDRAFDSRVDIRLHYPTLDTAARRKVWFNFTVKFLGELSTDKADLDTLAEYELDGRQIKSAMKTAHLLASDKGEITGFRHIQTVLKIRKRKGSRQSSGSEN